jgi:hypothetical protein
MDEKTKIILDNFAAFLALNLKDRKELKHLNIDVSTWSLKGLRVSFEIFINKEPKIIDFDLREVKENENRFLHLLGYASDQILDKINSK